MHAANSYSLRKNNEHVVFPLLLLHVVSFLLFLFGVLWHAAYHNVCPDTGPPDGTGQGQCNSTAQNIFGHLQRHVKIRL